MDTETIHAKQVQRAVRYHDWERLLVIPFALNTTAERARDKVLNWIEEEEVDWYGDDDDEQGEKASFLILGCRETRI